MTEVEKYTFKAPISMEGERLDKVFSTLCEPLSRTRVKSLIAEEKVSVNAVVVTDPNYKIKGGETLEVTVPPLKEPDLVAQDIPLNIVYEDDDLIVIDKPAGMVVHPAPGNYDETLVNALLAHCGDSLSGISGEKRPGIVHRLDKETSGLLVIAKNDAVHLALQEQFVDRTLSRTYVAIAAGKVIPPAAVIDKPIGRHPRFRQKMAIVARGGKAARTHYRVEKYYGNFASLLECNLETGRTHQIRLHLASNGFPIIGDSVYGKHGKWEKELLNELSLSGWGGERHALHARALKFYHPILSKEVSFETPLPEDMKALMNVLESRGEETI